MRRSSAGGFIFSYLFSLYRHCVWAGLALLLFLLRIWIKAIPLLLPLAFVGVWLLAALVVILFLGWATKAGGKPSPPRENKNPYSAKNEDVFPGLKETETFTPDEWIGNIRTLWDAVSLLEVPIELFVDIVNQAAGSEDTSAEKICAFFDGLNEAGWLSQEEAPQREGCRGFLIDMDDEICCLGAVCDENAEAFVTSLRYYFLRMGCGYTVELLGGDILPKKTVAALLLHDFYPLLEAEGFVYNGDRFHRVIGPVAHVAEIRHTPRRQIYQVTMGAHLLPLGEYAMDCTGRPAKDPAALRCFDCAWQQSITVGDGLTEWAYGDTEEESAEVIKRLAGEWPGQSAAFFGPLTRWPEDFLAGAGAALAAPVHPIGMRLWARAAALAGDFALARALAEKALPDVPEYADALRAMLEEFIRDPESAVPAISG